MDGRGWLDGELRKIGAGLDRMKLGTRHALREGACLAFFLVLGRVAARADWEGGCAGRLGRWLCGQIGKVAARADWEGGCADAGRMCLSCFLVPVSECKKP